MLHFHQVNTGRSAPAQLITNLQQAANSHAPLPRLAALKLRPLLHASRLNTQHILIPLLRLKVRHTLGLLDPWVPDNDILELLSCDLVGWSTGDGNGNFVVEGFWCVDSVDLGGEGKNVGGGDGWVAGYELVDVGDALEAVDCGSFDVLRRTVSIFLTSISQFASN